MDGDLQDPPELFKEMYKKLINKNSNIKYGKRIERKENLQKKLFIKLKILLKKEEAADVGNFLMLNRKTLDSLLSIEEKNRYLPGLRFNQGDNFFIMKINLSKN